MRILCVILISLLCIQSYGQSYGIKAGLNLANFLDKDDDDTYSDDYKMNMGFHVGGTLDYPLTDLLSLETGLLLTTKGMKIEEEFLGANITAKLNLFYLDIPITLKAGYDLGGAKIYGVIGPYVGMGLSGKIKTEVEYQGDTETETEDIVWGNDEAEDDLKRLDFGLTFGAGAEINVIQIGASYDFGLMNTSPYTENGYKTNNRVLKFSVGYRFGL